MQLKARVCISMRVRPNNMYVLPCSVFSSFWTPSEGKKERRTMDFTDIKQCSINHMKRSPSPEYKNVSMVPSKDSLDKPMLCRQRIYAYNIIQRQLRKTKGCDLCHAFYHQCQNPEVEYKRYN
jgi:hypothetical protein